MRPLPFVMLAATGCLCLSSALAQNSIGSVAVEDATVSGNLSVTGGRAVLTGNSTILAKDHTADIALSRGGSIRVCATSRLHLTQNQTPNKQPLMLALDQGALEIQAAAVANDSLLTPDLRFSIQDPGQLDLRVRVAPNGDTCVENRGAHAPKLNITDAFGSASYDVFGDQHVLFEHGSLREVVDKETSPCGCPPASTGISIADALVTSKSEGSSATEQHPFPAAVSQGLAPAPPIPQATSGVTHAQVSSTLGYNGDGSGTISGASQPARSARPSQENALPSAEPNAPKSGFFHGIGHFFKHLFHS